MKILVIGAQNSKSGGAGTIERTIIDSLKSDINMNENWTFEFEEEAQPIRKRVITWLDLLVANVLWINKGIFTYKILSRLFTSYKSLFENRLQRREINFVIFLGTFERAILLRQIPFAVAVWDLGHLDYPWLPEYSNGFYFEYRQSLLASVLPRSNYILAASSDIKERLAKFNGVDPHKILEVPFFSLEAPEIRSSLNDTRLPASIKIELTKDQYVYYPANFWKHKNHDVLLASIHYLKKNHIPYRKLVLSGSDKGQLPVIRNLVEKYELDRDVFFVGFLNRSDVETLMKHASWLAMPTSLGPTNLPPLESLLLGTPCAISPTCREQFPNWPYVLKFDSTDWKLWVKVFDKKSNPPGVDIRQVAKFNEQNRKQFLLTVQNALLQITKQDVFGDVSLT